MAARVGKVADVYMQTATTSTAFTTEATTAVSATRYQINDTAKRAWLVGNDYSGNADTVTVYANASACTSTTYHLERAGGIVVFDSDPSATITVTGRYVTVAVQGYFFNWSLSTDCDALEVTDFADACGTAHRSYVAGLVGWSATGELFTQDDTYWNLADGDIVYLALWEDATNKWEGHVLITNHTVNANVDGVLTTPITFQGTCPADAPLNSPGVYWR